MLRKYGKNSHCPEQIRDNEDWLKKTESQALHQANA